MWQRLFVLRRSVMMTRLCLDDNGCPPSALQSSTPSGLNFDPVVHLSVDPCVDLSAGLVLVGGAYCVPQVPVPQTCGPQRDQITSTCPPAPSALLTCSVLLQPVLRSDCDVSDRGYLSFLLRIHGKTLA